MMAQEWVEELEKDLAEAVEVKNRDSLHRYMSRLAEQFGKTGEASGSGGGGSEQPSSTDKRFEELIHNMDKRFEAVDKRFEDMHKSMDKRFEAVDKRFEDMQKNMDKRFEELTHNMNNRFEDMDKRFNSMQMLMVLGFTVLATMMTVIRLFG